MTTTDTKKRTGRQIDVLPRGTISQRSEQTEFELQQKPDGEFNYKLKKALKKRAVKGTSDYIDFNDAMRVGNDILWHGRQPQVGFYIILSVNCGRRVSDVLKFKHSDLIGRKVGDVLQIREQKTGKVVDITLNATVIEAYQYLTRRMKCKHNEYIFLSQKGGVFYTTTINRMLKRVFAGYAPVISSHSLRKSFGRHVYNQLGKNEDALVYLSELFNHSSLAVTRKYLGIRKQELANIYLSL
jgi:integrase